MRPTPIPDSEVWNGARRIIVAPPDGDMTNPDVAPVEVLLDRANLGPRMSARCVLEDGDLERLMAGGTVWVSFYGGTLIPFSIDVQPPAAEARPCVRLDVDLSGPMPEFHAHIVCCPQGMTQPDFLDGCAEAMTAMATAWRAEEAAT